MEAALAEDKVASQLARSPTVHFARLNHLHHLAGFIIADIKFKHVFLHMPDQCPLPNTIIMSASGSPAGANH